MDNIKVTQLPTMSNPDLLTEQELRAALHHANADIFDLSEKLMHVEGALGVLGSSVHELLTVFCTPDVDSESVAEAIKKFMHRHLRVNTPSASVH